MNILKGEMRAITVKEKLGAREVET